MSPASGAQPLYAQVEAVLAAAIQDGALAPGACLPPELELTQRFGVSRTTIRQTIQNLVRRGLVEIRRGRGTYVSEPKIAQELTELSGFVEDMQAVGRTASAKVLSTEIVPASEAVANKLELAIGTPVVRIARVRLADDRPISLDETYLPRALGEQVLRHDLAREAIFPLLEEQYDTPLIEAEYRLEAVAATSSVARALNVAEGSPIFLIERTSYSTDRRPVDYEKLHYRGDQVQFVTRLARRNAPKSQA